MAKTIKLLKNRSDIGAGTRGSDLGIDAIEIAAINKGNHYFDQFDFEDIDTHNETVYDKVNNSFAIRIGHVVEQCKRVSSAVYKSLRKGQFPLVLSGDHSSALGTISGIKKKYPDKRLAVIWIDAHGDLHSPYTSPSGNIHGMPLAAALNEDNLNYKINELADSVKTHWTAMKNIGIDGPKMSGEDVFFFGVRSTEPPEDQQIKKLGIRNYKVEELRFRSIDVCLKEVIEKLKDVDLIYISFDVDSMDCDMISYGTGTPAPKGFDQYEVIQIINTLIVTKKVVSLEFVEINPLLDTKGNKMAETAFEILNAITTHIQSN